MDHRGLRFSRGLLPLKKRKVSLDNWQATQVGYTVDFHNQLELHDSVVNFSEDLGNCLDENKNLGMAALSLVATAAVSAFGTPISTLRHEYDLLRLKRGMREGDKDVKFLHREEKKIAIANHSLRYDSNHHGSQYLEETTCQENGRKQRAQNLLLSQNHQDKRYTGCEGEVRCLATTTRGRACAYACVVGTKYCYLHADYDTNPPPRRWSHKGKTNVPELSENVAPLMIGSVVDTNVREVDCHQETELVPNSSPPSLSSDEMSRLPSPFCFLTSENPTKRSRRTSSTKLATKHADSPFPLLSMISTDQWYEKSVIIACGPFATKVGKVEKWGNGWVSVNVPGIGLHNRRSFELYLHAIDEKEQDSGTGDSRKKVDHHDNSLSIFRCVSREAASPIMYPTLKHYNTASNADDGSSESIEVSDIPKRFQSLPPSSVSQKPRPIFGQSPYGDPRCDLSPVRQRGEIDITQAPKVTPLPSRETHSYDERIFANRLSIPESSAQNGLSHKRNF
jgi:hypothetical protein